MTELVWIERPSGLAEVFKTAKMPKGKPRHGGSKYEAVPKRRAYYLVEKRDGLEIARGAIELVWPVNRANFAWVEIADTAGNAEARVRTYLERVAAALVELEGP